MVNGPECLVKMAQVAESAVAANLFDRHVGDGQLRDGIAHTEFIDQFGERLVEMDAHDSVHMVDIPIAQIDKARHAPGKMLGAVVFLNGIEEPQGDLGIILDLLIGRNSPENKEQQTIQLQPGAPVFHRLFGSRRKSFDDILREFDMERQQRGAPEIEVAVPEIAAAQKINRFGRECDVDQGDPAPRRRKSMAVPRADHHHVAGRKPDLPPVDMMVPGAFFDPQDLGIIMRMQR